MSISIKNDQDIGVMRAGGQILADILKKVAAAAQPGVTTEELNQLALALCKEAGVTPSCVGYHGYPAAICTSIDDQVVHCIPDDTVLADGSILSIDFVVEKDGLNTDACISVPIGNAPEEAKKLLNVTREALDLGVAQAVAGNHIGDISHAIQTHVESNGYTPVRETCGHGIGTKLHEDPEVPNWGRPGTGPELVPGMTICIEPIIVEGDHQIITEPDGWTTRTRDGGLCAHFEFTVLITESGAPEILTPWHEA